MANSTQQSQPPQAELDQIIGLYTQGQLEKTVPLAEGLAKKYPKALILYEILGAAYLGLKNTDKTIESYQKALHLNPDHTDAYNNMGLVLYDQCRFDEAIESYKKAVSLEPSFADAHYNLGNALNQAGYLKQAIESYKTSLTINPNDSELLFRYGNALKNNDELALAKNLYEKALELNPDLAEAKHQLFSITGQTPNSAPRKYVENLFDVYASKFDRSLLGNLAYNVPKELTKIIISKQPEGSLGSILDLGCGTGLAGMELSNLCGRLDGVDLSKFMVKQAKEKSIYDQLIHDDIVDYLSAADLNYNYFVATDVFIYLGELSEVFKLIKSRNKRSGKLAFSTEHNEVENYFLEISGRFSHSKQYIEKLCDKFDYRVSHFSKTNLRKEKDAFLTGGLYLLDF